jgi:hypothetical protein
VRLDGRGESAECTPLLHIATQRPGKRQRPNTGLADIKPAGCQEIGEQALEPTARTVLLSRTSPQCTARSCP